VADLLHHLSHGFLTALSPYNFYYCLIGAALGTFVGILPGLGPITTIAMLLPITFKLPAVTSLIMLSGIYYGAHHSGSTTAVMLNMPGEPTSVVICMDGHPMARKGRAGTALSTAAIASFFAGCVGVLIIAVFSPLLSKVALLFGPAEYASMVVMALITVAALSTEGPLLSTIAMSVLGLLLGTVGTDVGSGVGRFTFGRAELADGLSFVAVAVGFFAIVEVILFASGSKPKKPMDIKVTRLLPTWQDLKDMAMPIVRGTIIGSILGTLPGTGPLTSSYASYAAERRLSKTPERFGHGAIEGIAAPEAANNAATITHFIPMLTLGIPAGAAMALMLGAMMIQGITPGPAFVTEHETVFWGLVASMWIGNLMLLVLNLPLIGIWIRMLSIPYRLLFPIIVVFCCIGVYSVSNSVTDVYLTAVCAAFGVAFRQFGCAAAPLVLGLVLGPTLEENVQRALTISRGDYAIFVTRPLSLALLLVGVGLAYAFSSRKMRVRTAALVTD
jgi:TctA family transporter